MTVIAKPTTPFFVLLIILLIATLQVEAAQRHKWWGTGDVKTELKLTDQQSETLENIYQAARRKLRTLTQTLTREETALSLLIDEVSAQESDVANQIDEVEVARGALSKERLLMIYRMRQELSSNQRDLLKTWHNKNRQQERMERQKSTDTDQLRRRQRSFPSGRRGDQRRQ
tara:strand:- start:3385 stop:3900 length:516 start_codon:yes stop_codon:yes gene_type:complete